VQPTVSWSASEYQALGIDFRSRGAILDEQLAVMDAVWTAPPNSPTSYSGTHFEFENVWCEPRRGVPVSQWFGGERLHDALIRRIVRYGSGFHPFGTPTTEELERLSEAMRDAGRSLNDLELIGGIRGRFETLDDRGVGGVGGVADLDAALISIPEKVAAGYRSICFKPSMFTDDLRDVADVCKRVVAALEHAA
jgi:hypothetical protein